MVRITTNQIIAALEVCTESDAINELCTTLKVLPVEELKRLITPGLFEKLMVGGDVSLSTRWLLEHIVRNDVVDTSVVIDVMDRLRKAGAPLLTVYSDTNLNLLIKAVSEHPQQVKDRMVKDLITLSVREYEGDEGWEAQKVLQALCEVAPHHVDTVIAGVQSRKMKRDQASAALSLLGELIEVRPDRGVDLFTLGCEIAERCKAEFSYDFLLPRQGLAAVFAKKPSLVTSSICERMLHLAEEAASNDTQDRACGALEAVAFILDKKPKLATDAIVKSLTEIAHEARWDQDTKEPLAGEFAIRLLGKLAQTRSDLFNDAYFDSNEDNIAKSDKRDNAAYEYGAILKRVVASNPKVATQKLCAHIIKRLNSAETDTIVHLAKHRSDLMPYCLDALVKKMGREPGGHVSEPIAIEKIIIHNPPLASMPLYEALARKAKAYPPHSTEYISRAMGAIVVAMPDKFPRNANRAIWKLIVQMKKAGYSAT